MLIGDGMPARRPDIEACPALHRYHDDVIDLLTREGSIGTRNPTFWRLKDALWNRRMPPLSSEDLHAQLYLTRLDVIGFLVSLSLETGMEIECLKSLKADCLRNPSRGYVEIEYRKRRARGAEWKRLRVRNGGGSTPGGIIRQAIRLTERARRYLGADALWAWWNGYRLSGPRISPRSVLAFVAKHELTGDDGRPLHTGAVAAAQDAEKRNVTCARRGSLSTTSPSVTRLPSQRVTMPTSRLCGTSMNIRSPMLCGKRSNSALKPKLITLVMEEAVRASPKSFGTAGSIRSSRGAP